MDRSELEDDQEAQDEAPVDLEVQDGFIGGTTDFKEGG